MNQMNRLFKLLGRTILVVLLAGLISSIALPTMSVSALPFFGNNSSENSSDPGSMNRTGNRHYDERGNVNVIQADESKEVDKSTIKRIESKVGDRVGDRAVGDTGLKNIKELGKNIPENLDRMTKQATGGKAPNQVADDAQNKVKGAVKETKRAVKDNL